MDLVLLVSTRMVTAWPNTNRKGALRCSFSFINLLIFNYMSKRTWNGGNSKYNLWRYFWDKRYRRLVNQDRYKEEAKKNGYSDEEIEKALSSDEHDWYAYEGAGSDGALGGLREGLDNAGDWFEEKVGNDGKTKSWFENLGDKLSDVGDALVDNLTGKTQERLNAQQNEFNHNEAQIEREWNSIGSQMERASSAGVNPISIAMQNNGMNFGGTSNAQASAGSSGSPSTNILDAVGSGANAFGGVAGGILNLAKTKETTSLLDTQLLINQRNADLITQQYESYKLSNSAQRVVNQWLPYTLKSEVDLKSSMKELNIVERAKVNKVSEQLDKYINEQMPEEIRLIKEQANCSAVDVKRIESQIRLNAMEAYRAEMQGDLANEQAFTEEQINQREAFINQYMRDHLDAYYNYIGECWDSVRAQNNLTDKQAGCVIANTVIQGIGTAVGAGTSIYGAKTGRMNATRPVESPSNYTQVQRNADGNVTGSMTRTYW